MKRLAYRMAVAKCDTWPWNLCRQIFHSDMTFGDAPIWIPFGSPWQGLAMCCLDWWVKCRQDWENHGQSQRDQDFELFVSWEINEPNMSCPVCGTFWPIRPFGIMDPQWSSYFLLFDPPILLVEPMVLLRPKKQNRNSSWLCLTTGPSYIPWLVIHVCQNQSWIKIGVWILHIFSGLTHGFKPSWGYQLVEGLQRLILNTNTTARVSWLQIKPGFWCSLSPWLFWWDRELPKMLRQNGFNSKTVSF